MKTIKLLLVAALAIFLTKTNAQTTPPIQWQKSLGGSGSDVPITMHQTSDGGYIVIGTTNSTNGDVTGHSNPATTDIWIAKLNSAGSLDWENTYGGFNNETAGDIQQTSDGGYIFVGTSASSDVYVPVNHGLSDCWIVKLDASGNITWQKSMGGSNIDSGEGVRETSDGNFIIAAYSRSGDGDVTNNHFPGNSDAWIIKLSSSGNLLWQKCYGGTSSESAFDVTEVAGGNFVFCGGSQTVGGDVTTNYGGVDAWFVKVNGTDGTLIWSYSYGGSLDDQVFSIKTTQDANINLVATGFTRSPNDFNVTGNHGGSDVCVLTISSTGILNSAKCFGGSADDYAYCVTPTYDQGYLITGLTYSNDGDVTNHSNVLIPDAWVVKLNQGMNIDWENAFGGSGIDQGFYGIETSDGGYALASSSQSNDIDVSGNHGGNDFWIAKLNPCFIPPASTAVITPSTPTCGATATMSVPGGIQYTYQWKKNGNNISGATSRIFTTTKKGDYTCVVSNGACGSITSSNTIHNQPPVATISPSGIVNKCAAAMVSFSANTGAGLTYQWYKGSAAITGATNSTYTTANAGKFKVTVYNTATQCSKSSAKTTVNNVCREENLQPEELTATAFPNPANNEMQIEISNNNEETFLLQVYDLDGKRVASVSSKDFMNGTSLTLNTSSWPGGMYFCTLTADDGHRMLKSLKLIVQH